MLFRMTTAEKLDTRETILKAAADRILHYGYGKTTMSEIASDCGMSAGNIYRFFPSKIDIAEAMTRKFSAESLITYQAIMRDPHRSAFQKLQDLFAFRLERTFNMFDRNPKLIELAHIMAQERPSFIAEELTQERLLIEAILADGVAQGGFAPIESTAFTADIIQCATMKFRFPQFWSRLPLKDLRHELDGLMLLILNGLSLRKPAV
jgi:AcrR family transcriptional regulator